MIESIEKLREWSRWLDGAYAAEEGGHYHVYNRPLTASMKSCGELMREKCGEIEREIAERYMLLPVDADGVPIRVGDTIEYPNGRRDVVRFITVNDNMPTFNERGWVASKCRHVKPRTIEDVLEEFYHAVLNHDMDNTRLEQYADEIRELMEVRDG